MLSVNGITAQWEVMWVVVKKGEKRIVCIDHGGDLVSALEMYMKVKNAGKKVATLRCKNIAFPPPADWVDMEPVYAKRKGKVVVVDEVQSNPPTFNGKMDAYNGQGIWWCPYCMKLRRFEKRGWAEVEDMTFETEPQYCCPMCDISHNDWHVAKYNPLAQRIRNAKKSRGRRSKSGRRKRKR